MTASGANGAAQTQVDLTGITALQNVVSGTTVTLRLYAWGGTNAGATVAVGRLAGNDLVLGGTVSATSTNTSVEFATTNSSVSEGVGTVDLTLSITDEDATTDTDVDVVLIVGSAGRINSYTTQTVTFPGGSSTDETVTITVTDNSLCDGNATLTFELQNITGGQGTPQIGTNDQYALTITDNDLCTNVSFAVTSATVSEGVGTYDVTVNITDFSPSLATSVDVVLTSGDAGRINSYSTQTVTFPANDGTAQTVTLTVTDNGICDGSEVLTFELQNLTGGQGTPTVGPSRTLTITDDEVTVDPVATAGTSVGSTSFTANWNSIAGVTNYYLDVYTLTSTLATDLFISEYVEGSSSNKYIEIFNGTGASVDLSDYRLRLYVNGGVSPSNDVLLSGTLANGATIVYQNASAALYSGVNNTAVNFNGDDAVALYKISTASNVDIFGRIGEDPGAAWTGGGLTTVDKTLRRKSSVSGGVTTNPGSGFPTLATEWDQFNIDVVTDLGSHTYSALSTNYLPGYNNFDAGTNTSEVVTGIAGSTSYYYVVRAVGGCASAATSNEISVLTAAVTDYYSRATGDVEDPIWSDTPSGTAGPAFWTSGINMNVQSGDVVTNVNSVTVGDVIVAGTLILANGSSLTVDGDAFTVTGTLTPQDNSLVELFGEVVTISLAGTPSFYDVTVNNSSSATVNDPMAIRGTLFVEAGDFETTATGGVVMQSDANGTGRLGPVGGVFTGEITMQRYIPAGATNWRLMGSPVLGQTVNEWKDDFITAGFPGSNFPNFDNPVGSGNIWPSVRWYDESLAYADIDTGWVGVSSVSQSLALGQGFAAWCGTGLTTTTAFTVDMIGNPNIASTSIDVPLSYTNNSAPTIDGWNAVSNLLPSPILFSNIDRTNVEDYIWYYNPVNGNTAVYDISLDNGTNGATDTIQSSQAFLVKANAVSAQLSFNESDKVAQRAGGFFGGDQVSSFTGLRLKVTSAVNTYNDETVVIFNAGTAELDGDDVPKMTFAHPDAPQIATMAPTGEMIAISAFGEYNTDITIPVMVDVAVSGTYTVTASNMENLGLTCLVLEDLQTGTMTSLVEGASYSFAIDAADANDEARLLLHASAPVPFYADAARCFGSDGAGSIVHVGDAPMEIIWLNATNNVILQQTIAEGVAINDQLPAGEYTVRVSSAAGCGALEQTFRIEQPAAMEATADLVDATCPDMEDGLVDIQVLGGTAPYTYAWSNGSTEEDLVALPGTYGLSVTDANDCAFEAGSFVIGAGEAPVASATVESTTVLVNAPVFFDNTSGEMDSYFWEFGDGMTSVEATPTYSWAEAGTYTVTLTVSNGICSGTWTTDMSVELSTSMASAAATAGLNAYYANDKFIVAHGFDNGLKVVIDVFDATGRLHTTRVAAGSPARVSIPAEGLNNGIWFLRITNGNDQRTIRVPLVR